ncbi:acyl-CoA synthetase (AMP-forming)/AMP-acid ligase II [Bradyrhizobium sp. LM3.4]
MHNLGSTDHVLTVLPLFHGGGLNIQTTPALHHGATVTIHTRFTPEATLAAIERDRPTLAALVPTTMQSLADHPQWRTTDLSSLKAICTGSTMVPQHLIERFVARGVPQCCRFTVRPRPALLLCIRGSAAILRVRARAACPAYAAKPAILDDTGNELQAGSPGEIAVRGPNVFSGYWGAQQATREPLHNGWYLTGDIGRRAADGYFWVHDPKRNLIISGGENIYPAEVERALMEHPLVADCAVVGRPDPRWDEVPIAYVIRRPGVRLDAEALTAHAGSQLARFKVPREIIFTEELPRTALGKTQHFALKGLTRSSQYNDGD